MSSNTSFKNPEQNPIEVDGIIMGDVELKQAANQPDSEATDAAELLVDFNALLAKLKAAGLMVAD